MPDSRQPMRLRMDAAAWLADRGWGRPAQLLEVDLEAYTRRRARELGLDEDEAYRSVSSGLKLLRQGQRPGVAVPVLL
jgi:hypothetical protein